MDIRMARSCWILTKLRFNSEIHHPSKAGQQTRARIATTSVRKCFTKAYTSTACSERREKLKIRWLVKWKKKSWNLQNVPSSPTLSQERNSYVVLTGGTGLRKQATEPIVLSLVKAVQVRQIVKEKKIIQDKSDRPANSTLI